MLVHFEESDERLVETPPQHLFDLVGNPERAPEWDGSLNSVTKLTADPVGVGARYLETHRLLMRAHSIELEVAEYEPPFVVAFSTVAGGPPATTRFELAAAEHSGTLVRVTVSARADGFLVLLSPLLRRAIRRQLPRMLGELKTYCESPKSVLG